MFEVEETVERDDAETVLSPVFEVDETVERDDPQPAELLRDGVISQHSRLLPSEGVWSGTRNDHGVEQNLIENLVANLPLDEAQQQELREQLTAYGRLRGEAGLLQALSGGRTFRFTTPDGPRDAVLQLDRTGVQLVQMSAEELQKLPTGSTKLETSPRELSSRTLTRKANVAAVSGFLGDLIKEVAGIALNLRALLYIGVGDGRSTTTSGKRWVVRERTAKLGSQNQVFDVNFQLSWKLGEDSQTVAFAPTVRLAYPKSLLETPNATAERAERFESPDPVALPIEAQQLIANVDTYANVGDLQHQIMTSLPDWVRQDSTLNGNLSTSIDATALVEETAEGLVHGIGITKRTVFPDALTRPGADWSKHPEVRVRIKPLLKGFERVGDGSVDIATGEIWRASNEDQLVKSTVSGNDFGVRLRLLADPPKSEADGNQPSLQAGPLVQTGIAATREDSYAIRSGATTKDKSVEREGARRYRLDLSFAAEYRARPGARGMSDPVAVTPSDGAVYVWVREADAEEFEAVLKHALDPENQPRAGLSGPRGRAVSGAERRRAQAVLDGDGTFTSLVRLRGAAQLLAEAGRHIRKRLASAGIDESAVDWMEVDRQLGAGLGPHALENRFDAIKGRAAQPHRVEVRAGGRTFVFEVSGALGEVTHRQGLDKDTSFHATRLRNTGRRAGLKGAFGWNAQVAAGLRRKVREDGYGAKVYVGGVVGAGARGDRSVSSGFGVSAATGSRLKYSGKADLVSRAFELEMKVTETRDRSLWRGLSRSVGGFGPTRIVFPAHAEYRVARFLLDGTGDNGWNPGPPQRQDVHEFDEARRVDMRDSAVVSVADGYQVVNEAFRDAQTSAALAAKDGRYERGRVRVVDAFDAVKHTVTGGFGKERAAVRQATAPDEAPAGTRSHDPKFVMDLDPEWWRTRVAGMFRGIQVLDEGGREGTFFDRMQRGGFEMRVYNERALGPVTGDARWENVTKSEVLVSHGRGSGLSGELSGQVLAGAGDARLGFAARVSGSDEDSLTGATKTAASRKANLTMYSADLVVRVRADAWQHFLGQPNRKWEAISPYPNGTSSRFIDVVIRDGVRYVRSDTSATGLLDTDAPVSSERLPDDLPLLTDLGRGLDKGVTVTGFNPDPRLAGQGTLSEWAARAVAHAAPELFPGWKPESGEPAPLSDVMEALLQLDDEASIRQILNGGWDETVHRGQWFGKNYYTISVRAKQAPGAAEHLQYGDTGASGYSEATGTRALGAGSSRGVGLGAGVSVGSVVPGKTSSLQENQALLPGASLGWSKDEGSRQSNETGNYRQDRLESDARAAVRAPVELEITVHKHKVPPLLLSTITEGRAGSHAYRHPDRRAVGIPPNLSRLSGSVHLAVPEFLLRQRPDTSEAGARRDITETARATPSLQLAKALRDDWLTTSLVEAIGAARGNEDLVRRWFGPGTHNRAKIDALFSPDSLMGNLGFRRRMLSEDGYTTEFLVTDRFMSAKYEVQVRARLTDPRFREAWTGKVHQTKDGENRTEANSDTHDRGGNAGLGIAQLDQAAHSYSGPDSAGQFGDATSHGMSNTTTLENSTKTKNVTWRRYSAVPEYDIVIRSKLSFLPGWAEHRLEGANALVGTPVEFDVRSSEAQPFENPVIGDPPRSPAPWLPASVTEGAAFVSPPGDEPVSSDDVWNLVDGRARHIVLLATEAPRNQPLEFIETTPSKLAQELGKDVVALVERGGGRKQWRMFPADGSRPRRVDAVPTLPEVSEHASNAEAHRETQLSGARAEHDLAVASGEEDLLEAALERLTSATIASTSRESLNATGAERSLQMALQQLYSAWESGAAQSEIGALDAAVAEMAVFVGYEKSHKQLAEEVEAARERLGKLPTGRHAEITTDASKITKKESKWPAYIGQPTGEEAARMALIDEIAVLVADRLRVDGDKNAARELASVLAAEHRVRRTDGLLGGAPLASEVTEDDNAGPSNWAGPSGSGARPSSSGQQQTEVVREDSGQPEQFQFVDIRDSIAQELGVLADRLTELSQEPEVQQAVDTMVAAGLDPRNAWTKALGARLVDPGLSDMGVPPQELSGPDRSLAGLAKWFAESPSANLSEATGSVPSQPTTESSSGPGVTAETPLVPSDAAAEVSEPAVIEIDTFVQELEQLREYAGLPKSLDRNSVEVALSTVAEQVGVAPQDVFRVAELAGVHPSFLLLVPSEAIRSMAAGSQQSESGLENAVDAVSYAKIHYERFSRELVFLSDIPLGENARSAEGRERLAELLELDEYERSFLAQEWFTVEDALQIMRVEDAPAGSRRMHELFGWFHELGRIPTELTEVAGHVGLAPANPDVDEASAFAEEGPREQLRRRVAAARTNLGKLPEEHYAALIAQAVGITSAVGHAPLVIGEPTTEQRAQKELVDDITILVAERLHADGDVDAANRLAQDLVVEHDAQRTEGLPAGASSDSEMAEAFDDSSQSGGQDMGGPSGSAGPVEHLQLVAHDDVLTAAIEQAVQAGADPETARRMAIAYRLAGTGLRIEDLAWFAGLGDPLTSADLVRFGDWLHAEASTPDQLRAQGSTAGREAVIRWRFGLTAAESAELRNAGFSPEAVVSSAQNMALAGTELPALVRYLGTSSRVDGLEAELARISGETGLPQRDLLQVALRLWVPLPQLAPAASSIARMRDNGESADFVSGQIRYRLQQMRLRPADLSLFNRDWFDQAGHQLLASLANAGFSPLHLPQLARLGLRPVDLSIPGMVNLIGHLMPAENSGPEDLAAAVFGPEWRQHVPDGSAWFGLPAALDVLRELGLSADTGQAAALLRWFAQIEQVPRDIDGLAERWQVPGQSVFQLSYALNIRPELLEPFSPEVRSFAQAGNQVFAAVQGVLNGHQLTGASQRNRFLAMARQHGLDRHDWEGFGNYLVDQGSFADGAQLDRWSAAPEESRLRLVAQWREHDAHQRPEEVADSLGIGVADIDVLSVGADAYLIEGVLSAVGMIPSDLAVFNGLTTGIGVGRLRAFAENLQNVAPGMEVGGLMAVLSELSSMDEDGSPAPQEVADQETIARMQSVWAGLTPQQLGAFVDLLSGYGLRLTALVESSGWSMNEVEGDVLGSHLAWLRATGGLNLRDLMGWMSDPVTQFALRAGELGDFVQYVDGYGSLAELREEPERMREVAARWLVSLGPEDDVPGDLDIVDVVEEMHRHGLERADFPLVVEPFRQNPDPALRWEAISELAEQRHISERLALLLIGLPHMQDVELDLSWLNESTSRREHIVAVISDWVDFAGLVDDELSWFSGTGVVNMSELADFGDFLVDRSTTLDDLRADSDLRVEVVQEWDNHRTAAIPPDEGDQFWADEFAETAWFRPERDIPRLNRLMRIDPERIDAVPRAVVVGVSKALGRVPVEIPAIAGMRGVNPVLLLQSVHGLQALRLEPVRLVNLFTDDLRAMESMLKERQQAHGPLVRQFVARVEAVLGTVGLRHEAALAALSDFMQGVRGLERTRGVVGLDRLHLVMTEFDSSIPALLAGSEQMQQSARLIFARMSRLAGDTLRTGLREFHDNLLDADVDDDLTRTDPADVEEQLERFFEETSAENSLLVPRYPEPDPPPYDLPAGDRQAPSQTPEELPAFVESDPEHTLRPVADPVSDELRRLGDIVGVDGRQLVAFGRALHGASEAEIRQVGADLRNFALVMGAFGQQQRNTLFGAIDEATALGEARRTPLRMLNALLSRDPSDLGELYAERDWFGAVERLEHTDAMQHPDLVTVDVSDYPSDPSTAADFRSELHDLIEMHLTQRGFDLVRDPQLGEPAPTENSPITRFARLQHRLGMDSTHALRSYIENTRRIPDWLVGLADAVGLPQGHGPLLFSAAEQLGVDLIALPFFEAEIGELVQRGIPLNEWVRQIRFQLQEVGLADHRLLGWLLGRLQSGTMQVRDLGELNAYLGARQESLLDLINQSPDSAGRRVESWRLSRLGLRPATFGDDYRRMIQDWGGFAQVTRLLDEHGVGVQHRPVLLAYLAEQRTAAAPWASSPAEFFARTQREQRSPMGVLQEWVEQRRAQLGLSAERFRELAATGRFWPRALVDLVERARSEGLDVTRLVDVEAFTLLDPRYQAHWSSLGSLLNEFPGWSAARFTGQELQVPLSGAPLTTLDVYVTVSHWGHPGILDAYTSRQVTSPGGQVSAHDLIAITTLEAISAGRMQQPDLGSGSLEERQRAAIVARVASRGLSAFPQYQGGEVSTWRAVRQVSPPGVGSIVRTGEFVFAESAPRETRVGTEEIVYRPAPGQPWTVARQLRTDGTNSLVGFPPNARFLVISVESTNRVGSDGYPVTRIVYEALPTQRRSLSDDQDAPPAKRHRQQQNLEGEPGGVHRDDGGRLRGGSRRAQDEQGAGESSSVRDTDGVLERVVRVTPRAAWGLRFAELLTWLEKGKWSADVPPSEEVLVIAREADVQPPLSLDVTEGDRRRFREHLELIAHVLRQEGRAEALDFARGLVKYTEFYPVHGLRGGSPESPADSDQRHVGDESSSNAQSQGPSGSQNSTVSPGGAPNRRNDEQRRAASESSARLETIPELEEPAGDEGNEAIGNPDGEDHSARREDGTAAGEDSADADALSLLRNADADWEEAKRKYLGEGAPGREKMRQLVEYRKRYVDNLLEEVLRGDRSADDDMQAESREPSSGHPLSEDSDAAEVDRRDEIRQGKRSSQPATTEIGGPGTDTSETPAVRAAAQVEAEVEAYVAERRATNSVYIVDRSRLRSLHERLADALTRDDAEAERQIITELRAALRGKRFTGEPGLPGGSPDSSEERPVVRPPDGGLDWDLVVEEDRERGFVLAEPGTVVYRALDEGPEIVLQHGLRPKSPENISSLTSHVKTTGRTQFVSTTHDAGYRYKDRRYLYEVRTSKPGIDVGETFKKWGVYNSFPWEKEIAYVGTIPAGDILSVTDFETNPGTKVYSAPERPDGAGRSQDSQASEGSDARGDDTRDQRGHSGRDMSADESAGEASSSAQQAVEDPAGPDSPEHDADDQLSGESDGESGSGTATGADVSAGTLAVPEHGSQADASPEADPAHNGLGRLAQRKFDVIAARQRLDKLTQRRFRELTTRARQISAAVAGQPLYIGDPTPVQAARMALINDIVVLVTDSLYTSGEQAATDRAHALAAEHGLQPPGGLPGGARSDTEVLEEPSPLGSSGAATVVAEEPVVVGGEASHGFGAGPLTDESETPDVRAAAHNDETGQPVEKASGDDAGPGIGSSGTPVTRAANLVDAEVQAYIKERRETRSPYIVDESRVKSFRERLAEALAGRDVESADRIVAELRDVLRGKRATEGPGLPGGVSSSDGFDGLARLMLEDLEVLPSAGVVWGPAARWPWGGVVRFSADGVFAELVKPEGDSRVLNLGGGVVSAGRYGMAATYELLTQAGLNVGGGAQSLAGFDSLVSVVFGPGGEFALPQGTEWTPAMSALLDGGVVGVVRFSTDGLFAEQLDEFGNRRVVNVATGGVLYSGRYARELARELFVQAGLESVGGTVLPGVLSGGVEQGFVPVLDDVELMDGVGDLASSGAVGIDVAWGEKYAEYLRWLERGKGRAEASGEVLEIAAGAGVRLPVGVEVDDVPLLQRKRLREHLALIGRVLEQEGVGQAREFAQWLVARFPEFYGGGLSGQVGTFESSANEAGRFDSGMPAQAGPSFGGGVFVAGDGSGGVPVEPDVDGPLVSWVESASWADLKAADKGRRREVLGNPASRAVLARRLQAAGLTQRELARLTGLSAGTINNLVSEARAAEGVVGSLTDLAGSTGLSQSTISRLGGEAAGGGSLVGGPVSSVGEESSGLQLVEPAEGEGAGGQSGSVENSELAVDAVAAEAVRDVSAAWVGEVSWDAVQAMSAEVFRAVWDDVAAREVLAGRLAQLYRNNERVILGRVLKVLNERGRYSQRNLSEMVGCSQFLVGRLIQKAGDAGPLDVSGMDWTSVSGGGRDGGELGRESGDGVSGSVVDVGSWVAWLGSVEWRDLVNASLDGLRSVRNDSGIREVLGRRLQELYRSSDDSLGQVLKVLNERDGYSHRNLSKMVGCSQPTVTRLIQKADDAGPLSVSGSVVESPGVRAAVLVDAEVQAYVAERQAAGSVYIVDQSGLGSFRERLAETLARGDAEVAGQIISQLREALRGKRFTGETGLPGGSPSTMNVSSDERSVPVAPHQGVNWDLVTAEDRERGFVLTEPGMPVYRMLNNGPEDVLRSGLRPKDPDDIRSLEFHVTTTGRTQFVSTTSDATYRHNRRRYTYEIVSSEPGIDVLETFKKWGVRYPFPWEKEVAFPGTIPAKDIKKIVEHKAIVDEKTGKVIPISEVVYTAPESSDVVEQSHIPHQDPQNDEAGQPAVDESRSSSDSAGSVRLDGEGPDVQFGNVVDAEARTVVDAEVRAYVEERRRAGAVFIVDQSQLPQWVDRIADALTRGDRAAADGIRGELHDALRGSRAATTHEDTVPGLPGESLSDAPTRVPVEAGPSGSQQEIAREMNLHYWGQDPDLAAEHQRNLSRVADALHSGGEQAARELVRELRENDSLYGGGERQPRGFGGAPVQQTSVAGPDEVGPSNWHGGDASSAVDTGSMLEGSDVSAGEAASDPVGQLLAELNETTLSDVAPAGVLPERDLFGLLTPADPPEFLRGHDYSGITAGQGLDLLQRLDLKRPAPNWSDVAPHNLRDLDDFVLTRELAEHERGWAENETPLPAELQLLRARASIWLGGPLDTSSPAKVELRENIAASEEELRGWAPMVVFTDVPRAQFEEAAKLPVDHESGSLAGVREMLAWAEDNNVALVNVHEVFHSSWPMPHQEAFLAELAKQTKPGYTAASDYLRVAVGQRFGLPYSDGEYQTTWRLLGEMQHALDSREAYGVHKRGTTVNNDLLVLPKGHPFADKFFERMRDNYGKPQSEVHKAPAFLPAESFVTNPQLRPYRYSVIFRTGPINIARLADELGHKGGKRGAIAGPVMNTGGQWVSRPRPQPSISLGDRAATAELTKKVVQTLVRELHNRDGDLHLTLVADAVQRHEAPDVIWTAALGYLAQRPELAGLVRTVTDRELVTIASDQYEERRVELPEQARQYLRFLPGKETHRLAEYSRPAKMTQDPPEPDTASDQDHDGGPDHHDPQDDGSGHQE
ncbi:scabin-related ADP-ribosyltransferase [Saccharopolyspora shandongensis]|uniref:scabin-related ADP-ribosyltransferase n=1 Tax=Saccharopolyspora shandongensis TaxID=418495 RepID=UPI003F4CF682